MADEKLQGIPEGVKVDPQFYPAGPNDFELIRQRNQQDGTISAVIYKGERPGSAAGLRVTPMEGWTFVQDGFEVIFDPKQYKQANGRPRFVVAKLIPTKTVTVTATFKVDNEVAATRLEEALKAVPEMAGYQSMERTES